LEILIGDDYVAIFTIFISFDNVLPGNFLTRCGRDPGIANRCEGLLVKHIKIDLMLVHCTVKLDWNVYQPERDGSSPYGTNGAPPDLRTPSLSKGYHSD
jgi:hypothetical protein